MKPHNRSEAYWMVRSAPYVMAAALLTFAVSLFWIGPPLGFLLVAFSSGAVVFLFHSLKWSTGLEKFQILAIASGMVPLLIALTYLGGLQEVQFLTIYLASYMAGVVVFSGRVLGWVNKRGVDAQTMGNRCH